MKLAQPQDLSSRRIQQLLRQTTVHRSAGTRVEALSRQFLGHPYVSNPLIGSADEPEVFTASIAGFDCVTYVETILALARSSSVDEFVRWLRRIRYEHGQIEWRRRNHYMTTWIRNNAHLGVVRPLHVPGPSIEKTRVLNVVPGLPAIRVSFRCVPKRFLTRIEDRIRGGDLIFFASTRSHRDIFHCGIIVRERNELFMRHAARSRNGVVEQVLSEFLRDNRMSGVIVVRPA
jgi:hypothetical protein